MFVTTIQKSNGTLARASRGIPFSTPTALVRESPVGYAMVDHATFGSLAFVGHLQTVGAGGGAGLAGGGGGGASGSAQHAASTRLDTARVRQVFKVLTVAFLRSRVICPEARTGLLFRHLLNVQHVSLSAKSNRPARTRVGDEPHGGKGRKLTIGTSVRQLCEDGFHRAHQTTRKIRAFTEEDSFIA